LDQTHVPTLVEWAWLATLCNANPTFVGNLVARALTAASTERDKAAATWAKTLLGGDTDHEIVDLKDAVTLLRHGEDPLRAVLLVGLSNAHSQRRDRLGSFNFLEQAMAAAPNDLHIRLGLARALGAMGRFGEAEQLYLSVQHNVAVSQSYGNYCPPWSKLAAAVREQGQVPLPTAPPLRAAPPMWPPDDAFVDQSVIWTELAAISLATGEVDEARRRLNSSYESNPLSLDTLMGFVTLAGETDDIASLHTCMVRVAQWSERIDPDHLGRLVSLALSITHGEVVLDTLLQFGLLSAAAHQRYVTSLQARTGSATNVQIFDSFVGAVHTGSGNIADIKVQGPGPAFSKGE